MRQTALSCVQGLFLHFFNPFWRVLTNPKARCIGFKSSVRWSFSSLQQTHFCFVRVIVAFSLDIQVLMDHTNHKSVLFSVASSWHSDFDPVASNRKPMIEQILKHIRLTSVFLTCAPSWNPGLVTFKALEQHSMCLCHIWFQHWKTEKCQ